MLIACPSCAARYELDAAKLGPAGRKVRCAACQTPWHVDPPAADSPAAEQPPAPSPEETTALLEAELGRAPDSEPEIEAPAVDADPPAATIEPPPAAPAPLPPSRRKRQPRRAASGAADPRRKAARLPLALGCAGLAALAVLAWQRELAVRVAPQLAGVFAAAGLPVNVLGLRLSSVESALTEDGQGRFLVVEGDVTNIARAARTVPPIEVAVRDGSGEALYTWTTQPPRPQLEPSELVRFRARLATPPEAGRSVTVRFAADTR